MTYAGIKQGNLSIPLCQIARALRPLEETRCSIKPSRRIPFGNPGVIISSENDQVPLTLYSEYCTPCTAGGPAFA